jgi:ribose transport system ATP-binding protein
MTPTAVPPLLEMRGIEVSFSGVHALRGVDLTLHPGEVLALLGENGAGKSTLMKVLGGALTPDAGSIRIAGRDVAIRGPIEARRAGVALIHQEFQLVPRLSARQNIFLGREHTRAGFIRGRDERARALDLFRRIGVAVDPEVPSARLSVAQQQAVEIAKALSLDARILVMDEPSATLTPREVESLFRIIGDLKRQGLGVIYISHRLEEVFAIADRVMVLRDGQHVATRPATDLSRPQLIELMVGRPLKDEFPGRSVVIGEPRLVVRGLGGDRVVDVSFEVRRGEIVALTGLVGAGRTEVVRLIFGADRLDTGTIEVDGRPVRIRRPRDAIRAGIGLLTEDRKGQGLILGQSSSDNFGLPNLPAFSTAGFLRQRQERAAFSRFADQLRIRPPDPASKARHLSGGNQQKVILAKWLQSHAEVVIFDEPTRGVDVGAKYDIYLLMNELAARGKAILMVSSELPEVLGMADRVLVMREGQIAGEIRDVAAATQESILGLAVGGDGTLDPLVRDHIKE